VTAAWTLWQTAETDQWQWCLLAGDGRFECPVQTGNLATAANMIGNQTTRLLVRSEQLVLTETTVKARNKRQVAAALPFLLEEQLVVAPERLHLASRTGTATDSYQVAIIDRQLLTELLTRVTDQGIQLIGAYADIQALPLQSHSISVAIDADRAMIRSVDGLGFAAPLAIAEPLLRQLQNQQPASGQEPPATCYTTGEINDSVNLILQTLSLDPNSCQLVPEPLELLARGIETGSAINLLQGRFKSYVSSPQTKFPLLTLLLISIFLTLQATGFWQSHNQKRQQLTALSQQIGQNYQKHFGVIAPDGDFRQASPQLVGRSQIG